MKILTVFSIVLGFCYSFDFRYLHLPEGHVRQLFFTNEALRKLCLQQGPDEATGCPYYSLAEHPSCWGFESKCKEKQIKKLQNLITCSNPDDVAKFWKQADFGYAKEHLSSLTKYCKPRNQGKNSQSSLSCNAHLQFCTAKNIVIDFRNITELPTSEKQYRSDLIKGKGAILGNCEMNWPAFNKQTDRNGFLQSWKSELVHFTETESPVFDEDNPESECDLVVDRPAFVMKMDAGINMFHHYCDFINLYVTQVMLGILDRDIFIVNWHTSKRSYYDPFYDTWRAFTWHKTVEISELAHKRVCFKNVVFPLPPRMFYGLYYNMPLVKGCSRSSLFKSFHDFLAHRLNLTQSGPLKGTVRVVLLNRKTAHRNIKNADELVQAASKIRGVELTQVTFTPKMPFLKQIEHTLNADVFIGMHGAGLTHALFLPDWAVLFELFNCNDTRCYKDLANERGVKYMTWEKNDFLKKQGEGKHPTTGKEHPKFLDYMFDPKEFVRLVKKAVAYVRQHPVYRLSRKAKFNNLKDEL